MICDMKTKKERKKEVTKIQEIEKWIKRPWKKQLDGKYNKTTKKKKNTNKQNKTRAKQENKNELEFAEDRKIIDKIC